MFGTTGIPAEFGELNDVKGGSWEWLDAALEGVEERPDESVILLSLMFPWLPWPLTSRSARFASRIAPVKSKVFANFAGHLHVNYEEHFPEDGYSTYVTDATWDDEITLRRVSVFGDGERMIYEQELLSSSELLAAESIGPGVWGSGLPGLLTSARLPRAARRWVGLFAILSLSPFLWGVVTEVTILEVLAGPGPFRFLPVFARPSVWAVSVPFLVRCCS